MAHFIPDKSTRGSEQEERDPQDEGSENISLDEVSNVLASDEEENTSGEVSDTLCIACNANIRPTFYIPSDSSDTEEEYYDTHDHTFDEIEGDICFLLDTIENLLDDIERHILNGNNGYEGEDEIYDKDAASDQKDSAGDKDQEDKYLSNSDSDEDSKKPLDFFTANEGEDDNHGAKCGAFNNENEAQGDDSKDETEDDIGNSMNNEKN